jgi:nicotinamidase-related amidase
MKHIEEQPFTYSFDPTSTALILCGVTIEVCVNTTAREANDQGFEVRIAEDYVGSYFPEFHRAALDMIKAQGAIVGWISGSRSITSALVD